jgi:hypothetical protein
MFWLPSFLFSRISTAKNQGWQAHYKRSIHVEDIRRPPSASENCYEVEEIEWLEQTVQ